ncbi:MAG: hypothetical protein ABMB14_22380 [Myxococcota bacterium]
MRARWLLAFFVVTLGVDLVVATSEVSVLWLELGSEQPVSPLAWVRYGVTALQVGVSGFAAVFIGLAAVRGLGGDGRLLGSAARLAVVVGFGCVAGALLTVDCCGLVVWGSVAALAVAASEADPDR